ncbi:CbrC family protein [Campylobacter showae]|uniref:CbrC family protein n=1 Tax=Campylobacter showae TaxID=204 RepID=UPI000F087812|nr:CbrC family protein [Campylobacter showae]
MDKLRQRYIALQKAFWDSDGGAASVLALYDFKDELEKFDETEAKLVLVDVYELLGLKKSACELLGKICDAKDRKQLKKLGYLKQYAKNGNAGAIKPPKTASETARQSKKLKALPHFRYHPDPFKTGVFKEGVSVVCECCGQATDAYYCGSVYSVEDVNYLCPHCIASGAAAAKFDASFIQDADPLPPSTSDAQAKTEEPFKRTPGYFSWQGEHRLACCDDYCEFLGDIGTKELQEMGIAEDVFADYALRGEFAVEDVQSYLIAGGDMAGYLFRCARCGKYKIYVDAS